MFPPLCFVDVTSGIVPESSKEIMEDNLEEENYDLILGGTLETNIKFKIVEFFQEISMRFAQK